MSHAEATRPRVPLAVIHVAIGLAAGLCSGLFGVGGGLLIVPGLILLARAPQRTTTGTSLLALTPVSVVGLISYASHGAIDWLAAVLLAVGIVAGGILGARVARHVPTTIVIVIFALLLVGAGVRLILGDPSGAGRSAGLPVEVVVLLASGVVMGLLSGVVGAGSGVMIVPILVLGLGFESLVAKGVSMFAVFPNGITTGLLHLRRGNVDLRAAATIGAAGAVSVVVGSTLAVSIDASAGAVLFALFLFAIATQLVVREVRRRRRAAAAGEG